MAQKYTAYIVKAANRIDSIILEEDDEPDQKDLEKVFRIWCRTLRDVSIHLEVLDDLRRMAITQENYWEEYKQICENVHNFNEFLYRERDALIKAHVRITTRDLLLEQISDLRTIIKDFKIAPETIQASIKELSYVVCDLTNYYRDYSLEREERSQMFNRLKRLGAGIGGIAIIGINAGALAFGTGLSGPMQAVSTGAGGALIGAAVNIKE